jgi:DNA-binding HxlR family transcriptional regulator
LVLGAHRTTYDSSRDIFVVKIDEEGKDMVTSRYVTPGHYLVYNMALSQFMAKRPELCPVETTARIVGGRWRAAVLEQLFQGTKRFSELKRAITGITQRTLSQQLRDLQSSGIIERTVYPDAPPRVVYAITPLGKSLRPLLDTMCHWGKSHSAAMALKKLRASDRLQ